MFYEAHAGNKNYVQLAAHFDACNFRLRRPDLDSDTEELLTTIRRDFKPRMVEAKRPDILIYEGISFLPVSSIARDF